MERGQHFKLWTLHRSPFPFRNAEWHPCSSSPNQTAAVSSHWKCGYRRRQSWALGCPLCFAYSLEQRNIYNSWLNEPLCPWSRGLPSHAPGMAIVRSGRANQLEYSMAFALVQEMAPAAQGLVLWPHCFWSLVCQTFLRYQIKCFGQHLLGFKGKSQVFVSFLRYQYRLQKMLWDC